MSEDSVQCLECGKYFRSITWTHLRHKHNMDISQYLKQHPDAQLQCNELLELHSDVMSLLHKTPEFAEAHSKRVITRNASSIIQIKQIKGRGQIRWYRLPKLFHKHWIHFKFMHKRIKKGNLETDFPRNPKGFIAFIRYIGNPPKDMEWPTVGRGDHSKGYIRNNFAWQEGVENMTEGSHRWWYEIYPNV